MSGMIHKGTVVLSTGSWYELRDAASGASVEARIRGKIRLKGSRSTNPVVVGDRVDYVFDDRGEAVITGIHPRRNYIIRRASNLSKESHIIASNIDQAFIVVTLTQPVTNPEFIDRFLVTAEAYQIPATIILNKIDIVQALMPGAVEEFRTVYTGAGYPVVETSALEGHNVEKVKDLLRGKTTLLAGNSGVGKSSLVRAVEPSLDIRVGEISSSHHKGKHTTTFSQMFPLSSGGFIIDSPGIKGFGLIDMDPRELPHYFPEMMRLAPRCQYYNCTHTHEPGCAVMKAVDDGEVSELRYVSYLKMLEEEGKYR